MARPRVLVGKEKELIELWKSGLNLGEIGKMLGVSQSTVGLELDRLGIRKQPTRKAIEDEFNNVYGTDQFWYGLGIAWGIGSRAGEAFLVRHKDKLVAKSVHIATPYSSFFKLNAKDREQWVCKFPVTHPMFRYMESIGWEGRIEHDRKFPAGEINEVEFVRGFISVHYTHDTFRNKGRNVPRIRFYGSRNMLENVSRVLNEHLGTTIKKAQRHSRSDICHILYYTAKREVPMILDFIKNAPAPNGTGV